LQIQKNHNQGDTEKKPQCQQQRLARLARMVRKSAVFLSFFSDMTDVPAPAQLKCLVKEKTPCHIIVMIARLTFTQIPIALN
jgi:hypothetical protein